MSLNRKMYTGSAWLMLGTFYNNIVGFVVFVVLARILSADEIGAVLAAVVFIDFGRILIFGGIQEIGVKRNLFDEEFASTSFWLNIFIAFVVTAVVALAVSPVVANQMSAETGRALLLMSCMYIIDGARAVHVTKLRREFEYGAIATRGLLSNTIAGAAAILLCYQGFGADAMIVQRICQAAVTTVVTWRAAQWTPSFRFNLSLAKETYLLGTRIAVGRVLDFFSGRFPDLILVWLIGPAALAIFRIGSRCLDLGTQVLIQPIQDVSISIFSRQNEERERAKSMENLVTVASLVIFPAFLGLGAVAPVVVPLLFGDGWAHAGQVMTLASLFGVPYVLNRIIYSYVLVASKNGNDLMKMNLFSALATIVCCSMGIYFGLMGVTAGVVAASFATLMYSGVVTLGRYYPTVPRFFALAAGGFLASFMMAACVWLGRSAFGTDVPPVLQLILLILLGLCVHATAVVAIWRRRTLMLFKEFLRNRKTNKML